MASGSFNRLKALLLILMAIYYANLLVSGEQYHLIGPRLAWLWLFAVGALILMAGAYSLVRPEIAPSRDNAPAGARLWPLLLMAMPMALGTIIPARTLGAEESGVAGIVTALPRAQASRGLISPEQRTTLDWAMAIYDKPEASALDGEAADVIGFVYRDSRMAADQFILARVAVVCCVADAVAVGVVVQSNEGSRFAANSWARVTGTFHSGTLGGKALPVLIADDVAPVQAPEPPYLYP